jgi:predicted Zn-dependent protease
MSRARTVVFSILLAAATLVACVTTPETGRSAFIIISEDTEMKLGQDAWDDVRSKEHETRDPAKKAIVERVGRRLADVTTHPEWPWEFRVFENKQANAFCLPGGKVAVYTGLFPYLGNEAGLATVLGHEVFHAIGRHGAQRISQQLVIEGGVDVASLGEPRLRGPVMGLLGVGVVLPFSRSQESEADEVGLIYMARAGYDPAEAVEFWKRFAAGMEAGGRPPEFLSDHPSDEHRIERLEKLQPRARGEAAKAREHYGAGASL